MIVNNLYRIQDDEYLNSTALVVTFVVNNKKDDVFQKKARAWEKAYLDFLHSYSSDIITVYYSAEVGSFVSYFFMTFIFHANACTSTCFVFVSIVISLLITTISSHG